LADQECAIAYSQRFIHYLSFDRAQLLVAELFRATLPGGRLFFSASGLDSELATGYSGTIQLPAKRHGLLAEKIRQKHGIFEPVTLYTKMEFCRLFEPVGFRTVEVWTSPFGNIKGVFEKP
jgi:hypothetical protein